MIIDARIGARGTLYDDGVRIPCATWADTTTGEYEALLVDGETIVRRDGKPVRYRAKGKLTWIGSAPPLLDRPSSRVAFDRSKPIGLCEHAGCERPAKYFTLDEKPLPPEFGRFERTQAVYRHRWCEWHYRAPRLVAGNETIQEYDVKVRPS